MPGYGEIGSVFLRLGAFGFGGPIATMAMMEQEAVRRRSWVTPSEFAEIYAVCKVLPGPVSTQMAIYLGMKRAGNAMGGVLAGVLFVLPSFLMVLGLSAIYRYSGAVGRAGAFLSGLQAAALAVILLSVWTLGKPYRRDVRAWGICAASAGIVSARPGWEPLVILSAGLAGAFWRSRKVGAPTAGATRLRSVAWVLPAGSWLAAKGSVPLWVQLFWVCFKAGAFVFGTGLAIVPVLEAEAVDKHGWLTHSQFMDGLALGQVTPGPVVITSTFIGFLAGGFPGAFAATAGMFLPSFVNVLFLVPRVWRRFSGTPAAAGFTAFAIPAVIGGILGTMVQLSTLALDSWVASSLFAATLAIAALRRPPVWALLPAMGAAGGLIGWVTGWVG